MNEREPIDVKLIPSFSDRRDWDEDFGGGWFSLRVTLELAPWYWRVGWYSAPGNGHFFILYLGPLVLHLYA